MPLVPCINCNPNGGNLADPDCPYCNGKGWLETGEGTAADMAAARARSADLPQGPAPALARYPVAIQDWGGYLVALSNDHGLWMFDEANGWIAMEPLPQPGAEGA